MVNALWRYTNLAATIHLLGTRRITLLNPATWDDRNDAYFMAEYKRQKGARTVLALCFSQGQQTYHHWRVFSHGSDGVCIEFNKEKLLQAFEKDRNVRVGSVNYMDITQLRRLSRIHIDDLPFLKRAPYRAENEYRVVYCDPAESIEYRDYRIDLKWIRRITLSPWISEGLAESVKKALKSRGRAHLKVYRSTLIENDSWKELASRAVS